MPLRRRDTRERTRESKRREDKLSEDLIEQLLNLKNTFTQVLNSMCNKIEKDCKDNNNYEKVKELAKIKQKYSSLREEVCRIISEFTHATPTSKEERAAVQEGLNQCMSYLNRVHNSMESVLKKYEESIDNNCCDKESPHLHKVIDGNHIVIQLNKGTQSELDCVARLVNNVNCLPEEKRRSVFHKLCNVAEPEEEIGGGDGHAHVLKKPFTNQENNVAYKTRGKSYEESLPSSSLSFQKNTLMPQCHEQQYQQEFCQNWFFPEKIMESLLAGYSWHDNTIKRKTELNSYSSSAQLKEFPSVNTVDSQKRNISRKGSLQERSLNEKLGFSEVRIYDSRGNPLTDSNGIPLKNINGDLLVKFHHGKPISTLRGVPVFDQNSLPFVASIESPIFDVKGEPLRIYNQEGVPLTDEKGFVLKLSSGKFALRLDRYNRIISDACGRPLYDSQGRPITSRSMESTDQLPTSRSRIPTAEPPHVCSDKGFVFLSSERSSLLSLQRTQPAQRAFTLRNGTNFVGHPVYGKQCTIGSSKFGSILKKKLALYDCNKCPLTGSDGSVLLNVDDKLMVIFDKDGKPIRDCGNKLIYDAAGQPSNSPNFNPYLVIPNIKKPVDLIFDIQLYDFRGYPLLDLDGTPLINADGKPLIDFDDNGELTHDLNGQPIFDKAGIPLTKKNGCWITAQGVPYRVFDIKGYPLTTEKGGDLFDINNNPLIIVDEIGRPLYSRDEIPVYDVKGIKSTDKEFNPSLTPPTSILTRKVYMYDKPMKLYNRNGMPLTNTEGITMVNAHGRNLIQFNEEGIPVKDVFGEKIFDEFKKPLDCCKTENIVSMSGKPFRIYDKQGRSLTDINGLPLNLANGFCTIKFDNAGRPVTDFRNSELFDVNGRTLQDPHSNPDGYEEKDQIKLVKRDGTPVRVYNREGMPLTDSNGIILVNSDGSHLRLDDEQCPVSDYNGDSVYDETGQPYVTTATNIENEEEETNTDPFGRPLKDSCNEPQFDKYGRPLYDLYRRRLYDDNGTPLADAFGKYLINSTNEPKEVDLGFDPVILNSRAGFGTKSLTDLIGGPLFDCFGIPLYNQYGKPLIDIYGRPLYDNEGLPLCDLSGTPVSELVRQNGIPVLVKDIYKPIEVTKEVADLIDNVVIRSSRTEHSPHIPGIWILPTSNDCSTTKVTHAHPEKRMYCALLRMTLFDDGKKSFEILEAKPYNLEKS